ncbi:MAG: hypothetical protein J7M24_04775, partial [Candidatus Latescibacteria bacterium]|nr:hypothetical protein [Candidatus Latescibacterota bacterium]
MMGSRPPLAKKREIGKRRCVSRPILKGECHSAAWGCDVIPGSEFYLNISHGTTGKPDMRKTKNRP